jgi:hypothetical protein
MGMGWGKLKNLVATLDLSFVDIFQKQRRRKRIARILPLKVKRKRIANSHNLACA